MKKLILALVLAVSSFRVAAGEYCWNDKIKTVIVRNNAIYFTSEKSCPNWCQVDPAWNEQSRNLAYTQLLTAKATGGKITFYWNEHESGHQCQSTLPTYAKPSTIMLN